MIETEAGIDPRSRGGLVLHRRKGPENILLSSCSTAAKGSRVFIRLTAEQAEIKAAQNLQSIGSLPIEGESATEPGAGDLELIEREPFT